MPTYDYKEIVRRGFEEGVNGRNFALFDEYVAPDYVNYSVPAPVSGPQGLTLVIQSFINAFPDFQVTIEDMLAEGDRVATRGYFTGTHQGDFQGIAPTGKTIKASYLDIWGGKDGKLVENWVQMDTLGLLQQLGVITASTQAA